ncbi:MAG: AsmA-like C-terminal region-containing protein, partial [Comamonas sp.]
HDWRLDASPPPGWGERIRAVGQLRQPLLTLHPGRWRDWHGELYADYSQLDLAELAPYSADWPSAIRLDAGTGRMRAWARVAEGRPTDTTLDLAMRGVVLRQDAGTTGATPAPLALADLGGRLSWQDLPRGFALQTQGLQFSTADGLRWSGGNLSARYQAADGPEPAQAAFSGDQLDLGLLARVAQRLPLAAPLRQALADYAPRGLARELEAQWRGPAGTEAQTDATTQATEGGAGVPALLAGATWQARGRIDGLALAAGTAAQPTAASPYPSPGRPGLAGADVRFDLNQDGGSARVDMRRGQLVFPGVFEDAALPMDTLQARIVWRRQGGRNVIELPQLDFANADVAGHASGRWQSGPGTPGGAALLPGHLALQGELTRADGTRVHRYLPLAIPELTRHYVRDAVRAGRATHTVFKVDSDLDHFPPENARQGDFSIAADLEGVDFDYVPATLAARNHLLGGWPALAGVQAQLVFERQEMRVRQARGHFAGLPQLGIVQASARIAELGHAAPLLQIDGQVRGPLAQALDYVKRSPLDAMAGHAFAQSSATGDADVQLALRLPLAQATPATPTQVQGRAQIGQATLQFSPQTPRLEQTQGRVDFSERGFQISQARTRLLGGELQFSGSGERERPAAAPTDTAATAATSTAATPVAGGALKLQFEGQGTLTAAGLRQARELPLLARISRALDGQTHYRARLAVSQGLLQAHIDSDLVGLASRLPAPLDKAASVALPLRFESAVTGPRQDHIRVRLGELAKAEFVRELSGRAPLVQRGVIRIDAQGAPDAALPAAGVDLGVRLDTVDLGAWQKLLAGTPVAAGPAQGSADSGDQADPAAVAAASTPGAGPDGGADSDEDALASFLPDRWSLQAQRLQFEQHALNHIQASGTRQRSTWSAEVEADELAGHLAYSLGDGSAPGSLYARLQRLRLDTGRADAGGAARTVDDLLDRQPDTLPALDIAVQQLQLGGSDLGALRVLATNRGVRRLGAEGGQSGENGGNGSGDDSSDGGSGSGEDGSRQVHEWDLRTLSLSVPEATLKASGQWRIDASAPAGQRARQTLLDFTLQTRDAGRLLDRLGFAQLLRHGEGALKGRIHWRGSPLALDNASLGGTIDVDMRGGQFLKADPGPARLLGVLSLQALPRRLALDFRDTFSEGFAFDFVRGQAHIAQGVARTNNLQMKGVSAAVLMEGQADIARETQDLKVVVVPELNTGTMALIATAINPAVGLGTFLAQWVLHKPLLQSLTRTFHIQGTWADPRIERVQSTAADTRAVGEVAKEAADEATQQAADQAGAATAGAPVSESKPPADAGDSPEAGAAAR